ncbi:hypothetical protein H5410_040547 [Solanum commersonii]|uniref:BED-type domain-containing protein n=1 Tax=Solanum commersonii TaxID=4109 RepID=A0A9J5XP87_SOLCO|nr:hypothetical protein H5410_040547 [Solanum commersonii]
MTDASKTRDIGWNYGTQGATKDSVNCNFCGSTFNGGITQHKQHLVGGFKNVKQCIACPSVIREEVRAYMQNKIANNPKFQVRQPEEYIDIDNLDDMDEYAEMMPPSKTPKISSSGGVSSTARNVSKGPMNLYFPQKSTQKRVFEKGGGIDETKKILRERVIHSKKGHRLALLRLNDLVYIKYNRTLKRRYDARDLIDPIHLDNIDDSNEWLVGCPEDQEVQLVYEDDDLTWGSVATTIGADESIYHLKRLSSRSRALDKGKGVETTSTNSTSSRTRTLIDEDYEEEEDEEQYNDVEDVDLQSRVE